MMLMKPALRKFALTAHVTTTVGWLGAVAAYVALVIALLASQDVQTVRATYLAMKVILWFVIIPFGCGSIPGPGMSRFRDGVVRVACFVDALVFLVEVV